MARKRTAGRAHRGTNRKEETNTPRAPELRYMTATCMIADLFISCFGGYKTDGRNNARAFVNMLANAHDDVTGYSDMTMIDVLGKQIISNLRFSLTETINSVQVLSI